jgi:hypothetical protein
MTYPGHGVHYVQSRATTILVLGIPSLVVCGLLGPIAWYQGNQEMQRIAAGAVDPSTQGTVNAGRICGIVGTVLTGVGLVVGFAIGMAGV